jgi:hypothetical protein
VGGWILPVTMMVVVPMMTPMPMMMTVMPMVVMMAPMHFGGHLPGIILNRRGAAGAGQ